MEINCPENHQYEARYESRSVFIFAQGKQTDPLYEKFTPKQYLGDICVKCGNFIKRSQNIMNEVKLPGRSGNDY